MIPESDISLHNQVEAELQDTAGPFVIAEEKVLGAACRVFAERPPHLRQILENSRGFGDAEYMVYEGRRVRFAEHHARVASAARGLSERFGVGKGDRVAILAANRPEWVMAWWAAVSLGAIPVA